jgi:peptidoglycan/LPS O-acetylase OafA/YrhL
VNNRFGAPYLYLVGFSADLIAIALFMAWAIRNQDSIVGRMLNWKPVAYAGVLSYSLYIWQTFFLHVANPTPASRYPWNLVGLAAAHYSLTTPPSSRRCDCGTGCSVRQPAPT